MTMNNDKRKALGRGLESLLPAAPLSRPLRLRLSLRGTQEIAVDLIDTNPYQTRGRVREEA